MSQVVRAIEAHETGNRKLLQDGFSKLFQDVFSVKSQIQEVKCPEVAREYRIGVTIGSQVWVSELEVIKQGANVLGEAINRTKRQVIEAIFGEFRHDFMILERALYDRDFQKSRDTLRVIEQKMFGVE